MPLLTCPHCAEEFSPDQSPKPGSRVVCTVCFRSFKHGGSGSVAVADTDTNTGSSDLYESLLDDGSPSPRAADGPGGPQVPLKRTMRSLQHVKVDCSTAVRRPFEMTRAALATIGLLVFALLGYGAATWYFGQIKSIHEGVGKVGRVRETKHETAAAPIVEVAKKKADDGPLFDDPDRWTAPSEKPLKIGNVSVAITSALIDVVKLQDGTPLPQQRLILTMQIKNYSIRPLKFAGWSSATKLCYVPQRGNVERVPSSPGNPIVGAAEPTQIGSEGTLSDVLVFEIPELGKDLELDLVPNGQGDTFLFVIPGKRIKKQVTGGFVDYKMPVPNSTPPTPNNANPPPPVRPPQPGGFQGNMGGGFGGGVMVSADVANKVREEHQRRRTRIQEKYEAQRKAAKSSKARRDAEKARDASLEYLVVDLCRTHGISEADLDRIVKAEPGK